LPWWNYRTPKPGHPGAKNAQAAQLLKPTKA